MQFALGLVPGVVDQASETSLAASWQGLSLDLQGLGELSRWGASGPSHVEARCAVLGGLLASSDSRRSQPTRRLRRQCWLPGWTQPRVSPQSSVPVPSVPAAGAPQRT